MKRVTFVSCLLCMLCLACSSDDESSAPVATAQGVMQDKDGNEYRWVRIDTLDWMAENLHSGRRWDKLAKFTVSYSQAVRDSMFSIFGNYYSYDEALSECPKGWRLPTDDDWKCLERACGMSASETDCTGWRGQVKEVLTSTETINLRYGGELAAYYTSNIQLYQEYAYGIYWSSTIDDEMIDRCAYIRKITPVRNAVQRVSAPTDTRWYSVRYVRSATH